MAGRDPGGDGGRRRGRRLVVTLAIVAIAVAVVAAAVAVQYRRQIVSYLVHRKGAPTATVAYEPHDPPPELHVAVLGDIGDSGARLSATAAAVTELDRRTPYGALLLLGDNVYPSGDPARLDAVLFDPFRAVLDHAELLAILGNHDVSKGYGDAQMAAMGMPGRFWARTFGGVLIVGLDSNSHDDPAQLAFLDETLAASDARWKIVAIHHPPYSAGYQGSDLDVREAFTPILERHGVQLVLSGHEHDYQRSEPIRGVTYVVSGAAAGTRRTGEDDFTAVSFSWHHFVDLAVTGDRLVLRAVDQDGRVADELVLRIPEGSGAGS